MTPHPDANVIRLCDEHTAARGAYLAELRDDDQLQDAFFATMKLVVEAQPVTLAGLIAKAWIAKAEAQGPRGEHIEFTGASSRMAWGLVNDLVRLAGEPPTTETVLIDRCHRFAEAEFESWYRYCAEPDDKAADDMEWPVDAETLRWIIATPATTPDGWAAKALAVAAFNHNIHDDTEFAADDDLALTGSLIRNMVWPTRSAIIARLRAKYGPLPKGYTADGVFVGRESSP